MMSVKKECESSCESFTSAKPSVPVLRQIITGGTGSGKTYTGIHKAKELGSFIYLASNRQLVYETILKYGSTNDELSTGECFIAGDGDVYAVYESLNNINVNNYNTVIIDEAQYLTDIERNYELISVIENFKGNLLLLTATDNFTTSENENLLKDFEVIELKSRVKFKRQKISRDEFFRRVEAGEPSIYFHKFENECGEFGGQRITGQTNCLERLEHQLAFEKGEITFIECTNVLAQGVNFPATNVCIEVNQYDTPELIIQKLGRLGRFGFGHDKDKIMTYSYVRNEDEIKIHKKRIKKEKETVDLTRFWINQLNHFEILRKELLADLKELKEFQVLDLMYQNLDNYNIKTLEILDNHNVDIKKVLDKTSLNKYNKIKSDRFKLKNKIKKELINK